MKWIIAPTPEQAGTGKLDFCFTTPGEILIPGSKCSRGYPTDNCGCCRAMAGLASRKATTVGIIKENDKFDLRKIARQDVIKFWRDTLPAKEIENLSQQVIDFLFSVASEIEGYPVNTRICFKFNLVEPNQHSFEALMAGGATVADGFGV